MKRVESEKPANMKRASDDMPTALRIREKTVTQSACWLL